MVDLFSGAGGLSLGLERAGFEVAHAVEYDAAARASYLANRPALNGNVTKDIREVPRRDIATIAEAGRIDLVAGGPPCQGFSEVGNRHGDDERNNLFRQYIRWVNELEPRVALFENVRGFAVKNGGEYYEALTKSFEGIGYRPYANVFTATSFGVPQLRRRLVVVALKEGKGSLPHLAEAALPIQQPPSVMDAIGDLPSVKPGQAASSYTSTPKTVLQALLRGDSDSLRDHEAANHPASLVKAISYIPDGGNRTSIPPAHQPRSGYHNSYARLDSKEPAVAITSNMSKPSSARCIHPFQDRGLTAREGARLQTFPDSYVFEGGAVARRLQIGNAVPPFMAEALGHFVMKFALARSLTAGARERRELIANGTRPAGAVPKTVVAAFNDLEIQPAITVQRRRQR